MKNLPLILAGVLVLVTGCQTGQPVQQTSAIDNGRFMNLWSTYSRCQSTTEMEQLRQDAVTLTRAANHSLAQEAFVLPLPNKLERLVSTPAARLAVDVKAMAAACSLRAGSAAVEVGQLDVAKELLRTILRYQPHSEYTYYTTQAKTLLDELETNIVQVSLRIP